MKKTPAKKKVTKARAKASAKKPPVKTKLPKPASKTAGGKGEFTASLKLLGRTYTAKGSSVIEAIGNLQATGTRGNVSVLTVSKGTQSREKILNRFQTNRLFTPSRIMREITLKNTAALFDFQ